MDDLTIHNWKTIEDLRLLAKKYKSAVYDETHLGYQWRDKPHRNVYDLVNLVRQLADKLETVGLPGEPTYKDCPDIRLPYGCSFELNYNEIESKWGWAFNDHTDQFCGPATYLSHKEHSTMAEALADCKKFIETHYPSEI